jgi:hypothetical protein
MVEMLNAEPALAVKPALGVQPMSIFGIGFGAICIVASSAQTCRNQGNKRP